MRHVKTGFLLLMCCLLPLTAYAENKKISLSCEELVSIEIKQPPPGFAFPDEACGDKCFYIDFIMKECSTQSFIAEYNANKHVSRDLYIDNYFLFTADPFHLDAPYVPKVSSATIYPTLEGAVDDMRKTCPNAVIKTPDVVRR